MKRLILFSVLCLLFVGLNSQACQKECKAICSNGSMVHKITAKLDSLGQKIENAEVPVMGKLSNILPVAVVAFCLQKFPGQTMALLAFGFTYSLYCNEKIRGLLDDCTIIKGLRNKKAVNDVLREDTFEDNFFVFSGEDVLDAEEEEEDEEDLLDDSFDSDRKLPVTVKKSLSFL